MANIRVPKSALGESNDNDAGVMVIYPSEPSDALLRGLAQGSVVLESADGRPVNEIFRERLESMSDAEAKAFEERYLRLSRLYQGPGGP